MLVLLRGVPVRAFLPVQAGLAALTRSANPDTISSRQSSSTMAELVLTTAERDAALWTDLDDAALGAIVRKKISVLQTAAAQMDRTTTLAAALLLCCAAAEADASEMTMDLSAVTQGGRDFGDWSVVASRTTSVSNHESVTQQRAMTNTARPAEARRLALCLIKDRPMGMSLSEAGQVMLDALDGGAAWRDEVQRLSQFASTARNMNLRDQTNNLEDIAQRLAQLHALMSGEA